MTAEGRTASFDLNGCLSLIRAGRIAEAVGALRLSLESGNEAVAAQDVLVVTGALLLRSHIAEAIALLRCTKHRDAASPPIRAALARALSRSDERIAARIEADALRDGMPQTAPNLDLLHKLYVDLQSHECAEQAAYRLLHLEPDRFDIRRSLIDTLFRMRAFDKVRSELAALTSTEGCGAGDLVFAAKAHLRFERGDDARPAVIAARRALALGYEPALTARILLIEALILSGDRAQARQETMTAEAQADTAYDCALVAEHWVKLQRPAEALALARRGVEGGGPDAGAPLSRIRLAEIFAACGRVPEARRLLEAIDIVAIDMSTSQSPFVIRRLHDACYATGLDALALRSAGLGLSFNPHDLYYRERLSILKLMARDVPLRPGIAPTMTPGRGLLARLAARLYRRGG